MQQEQVPGPGLRVEVLRPQMRQFVQCGLWMRVAKLDRLLYFVRNPHITLGIKPVVMQFDKRNRDFIPIDCPRGDPQALAPFLVPPNGHAKGSLDPERVAPQLLPLRRPWQ